MEPKTSFLDSLAPLRCNLGAYLERDTGDPKPRVHDDPNGEVVFFDDLAAAYKTHHNKIRDIIFERIEAIRRWKNEGSGEPETLEVQLQTNRAFLDLLEQFR